MNRMIRRNMTVCGGLCSRVDEAENFVEDPPAIPCGIFAELKGLGVAHGVLLTLTLDTHVLDEALFSRELAELTKSAPVTTTRIASSPTGCASRLSRRCCTRPRVTLRPFRVSACAQASLDGCLTESCSVIAAAPTQPLVSHNSIDSSRCPSSESSPFEVLKYSCVTYIGRRNAGGVDVELLIVPVYELVWIWLLVAVHVQRDGYSHRLRSGEPLFGQLERLTGDCVVCLSCSCN